ncbi:hypothetical protein [Streptosporangium subroseum]|uniref:hypothetical protein n=1 Tax=Streptosporangium subroseum TaxID=106412 RepID=UPI003091E611|nr:hypothetical protein OHB15_24410 [Streptosporangium subroseum]
MVNVQAGVLGDVLGGDTGAPGRDHGVAQVGHTGGFLRSVRDCLRDNALSHAYL